ncbi:MAG: geranylgeranylglycerol-phosphate geranylgeranyltransferase [Actinomycetota bacterium]|jgi:geranylgeranylglycerol-phosphate geranylgeranyltransferase|nr:geranylgeranylglycerol-phosphate geranylgeranyltransferase [Actinomycetota bacterium]
MGYQPAPLRLDQPAAASLPGRATRAVLRLVRAENCVMAGVATLVGAGTATGAGAGVAGSGSASAALAGAVAAVMLVLAFGNVVNDLADQDADRLGKAGRPLPSGRVSTAQAGRLAAALLAGALAITLVTNPGQLLVVAVMAGVAALYTVFLKRVPLVGNAVFAGQCGATLVFGAQTAGGASRLTMAAALLVTVGILCVEVAKTVEDDRADRAVGIRTVAHLVAAVHQPWLVGGFAAAYVAVWAGLWPSARSPLLFALAAAPVIPLLAFAVLPPGPRPPSARVARFVVASKCLWPLALVALTGL